MSDNGRQIVRAEPNGYVMAIYILYLVSFFFGVTWVIGGIMAHLGGDDVPAWQKSHLRFQVRTFWIGLLFSIVSGLAVFAFGIGLLMLALTGIWIIVRCVKGIGWLQRGVAVPDPASWAFGGAGA